MGVPTYYTRLLADPSFGRAQCGNMRLFISGSAPLLADTHRAFAERTGHVIVERYGMSETVMLVSNPYFAHDGARIAGTVGKPLPGVEVRVVRDDGVPCDTGEIGAVEVKGPNVFSGYWRMPEKTREEFTADGWFRTGDVGHFGGPGVPSDVLTLVGRSKDLVISGGYNVYPKEIEDEIDRDSRRCRIRCDRFAASGLRRSCRGGRRRPRSCARGVIGDRGAQGSHRQLQGSQVRVSSSMNCRATRWARCRRMRCAIALSSGVHGCFDLDVRLP
jgi:acyl-CoA synthetase (AMP-forming)/AMP-acid ligase II